MITLKTIAEAVDGRLVGDETLSISGLSGIKDARRGDITLLTQPNFRKYLAECIASAIIVPEDTNIDELQGRNLIVVKNPAHAYVKVASLFSKLKKKEAGVSPLACVADSARISEEASVLPYAHIGKGAVIGRHSTIHPFAYIGEDVVIGEECTIYPHVVLYDGAIIGDRVAIHAGTVIGSDGFAYIWNGKEHLKIPQIGIVEIEDDVEIGANVTIDRASLGKTVIKKGTKIDNLVQIAHNVSIGENSIIVAQVGIAGSATVGKNVVLAGQVGVRDHANIGNNVKAGGGTGVTKDVPDNALISGYPHMPHREWMRLQSYLKRLPKLFERMKSMEKKHSMEDENG
jgi:UDP-3-O-[3-hydroxymyristoyl] glucosamine N-acyltransferase